MQGLSHVLSKERNARFHLFAATLVLIFSLFLHYYYPELALSSGEFAGILFAILLVFVSEIVNTAIERLADLNPRVGRTQRDDKTIEIVKDIMAGAVLVSASGAVIVGTVIFLPRILFLLGLTT